MNDKIKPPSAGIRRPKETKAKKVRKTMKNYMNIRGDIFLRSQRMADNRRRSWCRTFIERKILLQGGEKWIPRQKHLKWENSNSANYPTSSFVSVKLKKRQTLCLLWPLNELHWQSRSSEANSNSAGQQIPRRFLTAFTRARDMSLPWTKLNQSTPHILLIEEPF